MTVEVIEGASGGAGGGAGNLFGDGAGGDVTISVNTSLTTDAYYNNLTINYNTGGGVQYFLRTHNSNLSTPANNYRVFVKDTLTVHGSLNCDGQSNDTSSFISGNLSGTVGRAADGNGGGAGGSPGGNGSAGIAGGNLGSAIARARAGMGGIGGSGGVGGNSSTRNGGTFGAGGTITTVRNIRHLTTSFLISEDGLGTGELFHLAGGAGGGGGGGGAGGVGAGNFGGAGGAGGAGGGFLFVAAKNIIISATGIISAKGGNGAGGFSRTSSPSTLGTDAAGGGGGGGGGGGVVILVYETLSIESGGSISTAGGAGGAGGFAGIGVGNPGTTGNSGAVGKIILHNTLTGVSTSATVINGPFED